MVKISLSEHALSEQIPNNGQDKLKRAYGTQSIYQQWSDRLPKLQRACSSELKPIRPIFKQLWDRLSKLQRAIQVL